MRGWLNLKAPQEPNWLRFRFKLVTITTTIITAGIIITTTIITITTTIIITRRMRKKGRSRGRPFYLPRSLLLTS
jgi:hypothetical protein